MKNKREYTKENYLRNGTKSQSNNPKNKYVTTIEEPALNDLSESSMSVAFRSIIGSTASQAESVRT